MSGQTSLYDLCTDLLAAVAAGLAATPSGAPAYQLVSLGPPAFDCCPAVYTYVQSLSPHEMPIAAPDKRPTLPSVPLAILVAVMIRCVPTVQGAINITMPAPADLQASAKESYMDGWTVYNHLRTMARAKTLFPSSPTRPFWVNAMQPANPQGACGGWMVPVTVEVDGYTQA